MANVSRIIGIALAACIVLAPGILAAEPNTGTGGVHDCLGVGKSCGGWAAKGADTCRTCQQAQCKTENGKDVVAGNKTTTECYEGHGNPPASARGTSRPKAPPRDAKDTPRVAPGAPQKKPTTAPAKN